MKFDWMNALIFVGFGLFIGANGYIAGHTAAMHQHASIKEQSKMLRDEDGKINYMKYIIEAFKDCKRALDDPLGLKRELD